MNQVLVNKVNVWLVNLYKVIGTSLLILIVAALFSFLSVQGFFAASHSWIAPTILSPTDEPVLRLNLEIAQLSEARDKVAGERRELQVRLEGAQRLIDAHREYEEGFLAALEVERGAKAREFQGLLQLSERYAGVREEMTSTRSAYEGLARDRANLLFNTKLMDREEYLSFRQHLAQAARDSLALDERVVDLDTRREQLRQHLRGLDSMRAKLPVPGAMGSGRLPPDLLALQQDYVRAKLERVQAEQSHAALLESLRAADASLARQDRLLESLRASPSLKAIEGNVTIAFVPYENVENARPGAPLYACALTLVWCTEVGRVGNGLEGEVSRKHPIRQHILRGVMTEILLSDKRWARHQLLHLGRPPLLL